MLTHSKDLFEKHTHAQASAEAVKIVRVQECDVFSVVIKVQFWTGGVWVGWAVE